MLSGGSQPEQTEADVGIGRDFEKSPEMKGQAKSTVLGDTERPHVMHNLWQVAATPSIWGKMSESHQILLSEEESA